jgi:predicted transcriptional regulator of viral defense system
MSPWQNFYVIIPTEYKLRGIVPPSFYIDRLMKFLGRDYYVSLLSAAELNGAAHQKAMVFQTIVNGNAIRSGLKNGTRLEFTLRQNLPLDYTKKVKTQMGYMNVAGAELTALDIVAEEQKIGGLSRAAEILMELCETMQWDEAKLPLLAYFSGATIQRLGYLLELIEEIGQADNLYSLFKQTVKTMRRTPLKQSVATSEDMVIDNRWKIIVNYKIDTDEI